MTTHNILLGAGIILVPMLLTAALVATLRAYVFHRAKPTIYEILITFGVMVLLAVMVIPNFIQARVSSSKASCSANLKQIQGAKATWQLEQHKVSTEVPTDSDLFGSAAYLRNKPICPAGGVYHIGAVSEKARCSVGGPEHTLD